MLNVDILPYIGDMAITSLNPEQLEKDVTNRIIQRGAIALAGRVRMVIKMILDIPLKKRLIQYNPAQSISLPQPITRNHPAITEEQELASMLKGIWGYTENNPKNYIVTELAMKFAIYIFQRPNEIRGLLWESVKMDKCYLNFIASKTKQDHIVPLSDQAYGILKQIQQLQFNAIYVFPGVKTNKTFISNCTIGQGLKQIGFGGKQTAHGFRATARTLLDEELDTRSEKHH